MAWTDSVRRVRRAVCRIVEGARRRPCWHLRAGAL